MNSEPVRNTALIALAILTIAPTPASSATPLDPAAIVAAQRGVTKVLPGSRTKATRPAGPNPYLAFLPEGAAPDYAAWNEYLAARTKPRRTNPTALVVGSDVEPNDTPGTANPLPGFGTGPGEDPEATVSGLSGAPSTSVVGPFPEDDGSISLAPVVGIPSGTAVTWAGTIGDGPHGTGGSGSGDFDFIEIPGLGAGDEILIDMTTPNPAGDLDPFVSVWSSSGSLLAFNDDDGSSFDSFLLFEVPSSGTYYVCIAGFGAPFPGDPFDSSSGPGAGSEGSYDALVGINARDSDFFSVELDAGDVISAAASAGQDVSLFDPTGTLRVRAFSNANGLVPGPFPTGARSFSYVVETAGTWTVRQRGQAGSSYALDVRAGRPFLEGSAQGATQILFVDFDGATIDATPFGGPPSATLSPLSSFLSGWGLLPTDESAVIDAILARMVEDLSTDMRVLALNGDFDTSGIPGEFDIVLLNSRDHADPWGDARVSRVVIGGTTAELGVSTIGIAQSIDPGNFATAETSVVLLDLLSGFGANSLNLVSLGGGASVIDLVGVGVGNIASHEAGHFFANWHTLNSNATPNIMDSGGNLANTLGLGPDFVFGTGDDVDVDFGSDVFAAEVQAGIEDTRNSIAFGLSTGVGLCDAVPVAGCAAAGRAILLVKDKSPDKKDQVIFKWLKGSTVDQADLGDPTATTGYRLCVYDGTTLKREIEAPAAGSCAGKPCWKTLGPSAAPNGFKYVDRELTPNGTLAVTMKSGTTPKPKIIWKAKGENLGDDPLPFSADATAQVVNAETGECFEASFSGPGVIKNAPDFFKGKAP